MAGTTHDDENVIDRDAVADTAAGASGAAKWLLISDVDDTLTGDDAALHALADTLNENRERVCVALNSSRPAASVDATVASVFPEGFPIDAVITAMGTQVRVGGAWLDAWTQRFADWPRDAIVDVVATLGHRAHDAEYQTPHKASFAVPRGAAQDEVAQQLDAAGLPCRIIASGSDDLDILPPDGGKDHATRFVHAHFVQHFAVGENNLVVAGDSANDLAMFEAAPHAIAVGNARDELLSAMPADRAYHARSRHAAGVLEGLRRLGVVA